MTTKHEAVARPEVHGRLSAAPPTEALAPSELARVRLHVRRDVLHLTSPDGALHASFDPLGRLEGGHRGDFHFRVGLDGTVLWRTGAPTRTRRYAELEPADADAFSEAVASEARRALELWDRGALELERPARAGEPAVEPAEARAWLARIAGRGAAARREQATRFRAVYRPVPILPPDCYRSLVVQVTEGCVFNRCTFCRLYRDVPYRIKREAEIERHIAAVAELLGAALAARAHVFLGDANALLAPEPTLVYALDRIRALLPGPARGGVRSFIDGFSRAPGDLGKLAAHGLRRVYLGLETGHAPLLAALGKPGTPAGATAIVHAARRAGLEVGIIVLVGIGGRERADAHVADTVATLRAMELGAADAIFLSPLVAPPDAELPGGLLPPEEVAAQERALHAALAGRGPRVASYALERWIY
ncbi:MAG: radical SAM protein [Polyangiaceae bacterium]|nr:radical SAM protein [Polyangiaceae bacterium]